MIYTFLPLLAPVLLSLIAFGLVSIISKKSVWRFLKIVGFTILTARVLTFITIYFIGNSNLWRSVYSDNWNHFQLGLILILASLILRKPKKGAFLRLAGVGLGLVLDEVTDIFKLFGYQFRPGFRDSVNDLILICASFLLVVLIVTIINSRRTK